MHGEQDRTKDTPLQYSIGKGDGIQCNLSYYLISIDNFLMPMRQVSFKP